MAGAFDVRKMPKTIMCYICGQGFGTKSIAIHLKTCKTRYEQQQLLLEKKDRKSLPQPPRNWDKALKGGSVDKAEIENLNNEAFQGYQQALTKCQWCQRSFKQESFLRHQKVCTEEKPLNPFQERVVQKNRVELVKGDPKETKEKPIV